MASAKHPLLLAAAVAHGVLSLGHTTKGMEQFKHPGIRALPTALRGAVTGGWYEGSVFFAILGILNYKWAQTGLLDGADKAIASLITSLCVGFGVNYWRTGDRPTAVILSAVGILQAVGARGASV
ncbi:hypothetical protein BS50DRAFT_576049 [Corynespora cassiicola Philippines]|uniref:Integral membrane protein n=1 Tax=Corynespora cassiicola Philippines TaxID=1448308 RepID=A0A2T2NGW2_CORCC|nr:hypothetical protein BS50DRAFT_576049 [Corynespora cassiicola Philippines]